MLVLSSRNLYEKTLPRVDLLQLLPSPLCRIGVCAGWQVGDLASGLGDAFLALHGLDCEHVGESHARQGMLSQGHF